jgi:hypothetical protein
MNLNAAPDPTVQPVRDRCMIERMRAPAADDGRPLESDLRLTRCSLRLRAELGYKNASREALMKVAFGVSLGTNPVLLRREDRHKFTDLVKMLDD